MSEIDWHKIQRKLEGRCDVCGGELPDHRGVCPVYGEELQRKYDSLNASVKKISDIAEGIIRKHNV
jgi:hypothetical protein